MAIDTMNNLIHQRPDSNLIMLTYIIYGLHLFSAVTGVMTSAFIVTAFLAGWPSIIAVILNYIKRGDAQGSFLQSHFQWQIRTFWFSLLWLFVAALLFVTVVGIPLAFIMIFVIGVWVLYRMIRGLLCLNNGVAVQVSR